MRRAERDLEGLGLGGGCEYACECKRARGEGGLEAESHACVSGVMMIS
jgi:hypothetical protein